MPDEKPVALAREALDAVEGTSLAFTSRSTPKDVSHNC